MVVKIQCSHTQQCQADWCEFFKGEIADFRWTSMLDHFKKEPDATSIYTECMDLGEYITISLVNIAEGNKESIW